MQHVDLVNGNGINLLYLSTYFLILHLIKNKTSVCRYVRMYVLSVPFGGLLLGNGSS